MLAVSLRLPSRYRVALTSIEEKHAGWIGYYRASMGRLFHGQGGLDEWMVLLHYVTLHLSTPLLGFGLFLRSDANFLVAIATIIVSIQIVQRIYPGSEEEDDADDSAVSG